MPSQVWFGASTTEFQGSSTPAYSIPALVTDLYEKTLGAAPSIVAHACGGCSLTSWQGQAAWSDATGGNFDVVIVTPIRSAAPLSPPGATAALQQTLADAGDSDVLAWAPVQPGQDDTGAGGYFDCAAEDAALTGHPLRVAPVMQAMSAARAQGFAMDNDDVVGGGDPHFTRAGAYLVALTIFAELSGLNPVGTPPTHVFQGLCQSTPNAPNCVMTDEDALELQEIAWAAVGAMPQPDCSAYCGDSGPTPICE